jgi:Rps23 Pro-64 3,4-dihydroxylase Tpa1-like proline 4-hydroxylase
MSSHVQDAHRPGRGLHHEQHVHALEQHSIKVQEVAALAEVLSSPDYRRAVAALTGTPLDGADLTLDVWEYRSGDWLAPHVDKPEKLVTHIFYFTERWAIGDGGRLLILSSSDASDVARALAPRIGCSTLLVRSETSWHAVEQPVPGAAHRRSVTATFWKNENAFHEA